MNKKYLYVRPFILVSIIINTMNVFSSLPRLVRDKHYGTIAVYLGYSFGSLAMSMMTYYDHWKQYRIKLYWVIGQLTSVRFAIPLLDWEDRKTYMSPP